MIVMVKTKDRQLSCWVIIWAKTLFITISDIIAPTSIYSINWFLLLKKFSPPVNLPTYIISSLFKLTIMLVPLMLSHLLVYLPPLPLKSQTALFSMPRLISGINFYFHFVNQFHLFMLTSVNPSFSSPLFSSIIPSLFHSKLKTYFLVNLFPIDLLQ